MVCGLWGPGVLTEGLGRGPEGVVGGGRVCLGRVGERGSGGRGRGIRCGVGAVDIANCQVVNDVLDEMIA